jgi:hypothetical protein
MQLCANILVFIIQREDRHNRTPDGNPSLELSMACVQQDVGFTGRREVRWVVQPRSSWPYTKLSEDIMPSIFRALVQP